MQDHVNYKNNNTLILAYVYQSNEEKKTYTKYKWLKWLHLTGSCEKKYCVKANWSVVHPSNRRAPPLKLDRPFFL